MANMKHTIKGRAHLPNHNPDLDIEVDDQYEPYSKPIPGPTPFEDGFITWFNAFGVREKKSGRNFNIQYKVTLQALPVGKRLFYLHNNQPQEITPEDAGSGKIRFTLSIGDPPIGSFP
jgi:hypothetical protein